MKRVLLLLLITSGLCAKAQLYNNEWIDYNKTYYKFKIATTGLYRISQATLSSIGLGSTPAQNFQLWRNGKEIPLYTTVQTGPMGGSDYIEFWGEMNDGKPDLDLYRLAQFQMNDKWSLLTDTVAYFLTVNPAGGNLRLVPTPNNVGTNTLLPDSFFVHTVGKYFRDRINPGYAQDVVEYVYSSSYDQGEGWTSNDYGAGTTYQVDAQNNMYVYTGAGAPVPHFKINVAGNAYNTRTFRVRLNGDSLVGGVMNYFDYIKADIPILVASISGGSATVDITDLSGTPTDRMVVAQSEIVYPRQFNFGGATSFYFELPANTNGNYLEISNFNYNGIAPVLYDLTNGKRYVVDITNPALLKIALQPSSTNRKLMLVSEDPSGILTVSSFQQRNFLNLSLPANQGDYLIITSPVLNNGSNGSHPVDDYKNYRSSAAGGGFNVKTYMISELIDQFGFGIKMHPLSIRNFLRWARANFSSVKNVLLIGKGITYNQFRTSESNSIIDALNFVPTFGQPASDMLLSAAPGTSVPLIPIGRLSVISGDEITDYLNKVKEYELAQAFSSPLIQDKEWMKNVVHVIGASDPGLEATLKVFMARYKNTISDTLFGANVNSFTKTTVDPVQQLNNARMQTLFQQGISLLTYFGHSSSSTLDFNLETPQQYNNPGKYPVMIVMGCNAGNFFNFNPVRLQSKETLSEKFLLAQQRGSIAFIASSSLSIVPYLDIYNTGTYSAISTTHYNKTIGETLLESINRTFQVTSTNDFYARFHCEQTTLHGDPALHLNTFAKPDYVIEDPLVKVSPAFISVSDRFFQMDVKIKNLGKAVNRNIVVEVKRTYPSNNVTEVIKRDTIPGIRFIDSLSYQIPIIQTRDKGLNKITITVDADNNVDELYENNNSITKDVFIYEDEAKPVYPAQFAIVNNQNIKLYASTANPFSPSKQYTMELDTTQLFNSSFKITKTATSAGGVFDFTPGITFTDSTVYYWRVAPVPTSGQPVWNNSSFVYLPSSDPGYNQSHYYQHTYSDDHQIILNPADRKWKFDSLNHNLFVKNGVFFTAAITEGDLVVSVDGNPYIRSACIGFSLIFNIFDPNRCLPRVNATGADFQSDGSVCASSRQWNYEYTYMDSAHRRKAMNFMDSIPNGYIVVVRNILNNYQTTGFIDDWKADTAVYGHNNSLYHKLKAVGFDKLDSFTSPRAFAFIYVKNGNSFTPVSVISNGLYDNITLSQDIRTPDSVGYVTSPLFGPAKGWKQLKWRGSADNPGDITSVSVIGVKNDGTEATLFNNLDPSQQDFDVSSINASVYPYAKLKLNTMDSANFTPYQLRYWRLTYVPSPEGAIAPNIYFITKDTVEAGEPVNFKVAFKNISPVAFDSMKVKLVITDRNNVQNIIPVPRRRPLQPADDTLLIGTTINTTPFSGMNSLYLDVNPDNDQPEQYHFNNFLYRTLFVRPDSLNPVLDVTFDGVHILSGDIVSSKPGILVKLKDESKWMALDDTSLLTVQVRYPDGHLRRFYFNNDTLRFTPASPAPSANNTATVNFLPYFPDDGEYELIVTGKDKSNNSAGNIEYRVAFDVINKPMISNMLNYPNPFTSSTAFVFTITGSEVPQNIKIEIMTITGKIVREITKDELGPLHIGRNITEFKWDGTDQYGQKLANGVYLYRVVTNLNGKMLDKYKASGDNTDKYFNKGYGKMYLMR